MQADRLGYDTNETPLRRPKPGLGDCEGAVTVERRRACAFIPNQSMTSYLLQPPWHVRTSRGLLCTAPRGHLAVDGPHTRADCAQGKGPLSMPPLFPGAWPAGQYSSSYARPSAASPAESVGLLQAESESASVRVASLALAPTCRCGVALLSNCMATGICPAEHPESGCHQFERSQNALFWSRTPRLPSHVKDFSIREHHDAAAGRSLGCLPTPCR